MSANFFLVCPIWAKLHFSLAWEELSANVKCRILIDKARDYSMIISTEEFVYGGSYYLPGTSLFTYDSSFNEPPNGLELDWGELFHLKNYTTVGSEVVINIFTTA